MVGNGWEALRSLMKLKTTPLGNWSVIHLLIRLGQVGVRNQQNLYPRIPTTDVAKLLQYSGSRVEHGDGFFS